ncbi:MAG: cytochrome c [Anaerolineales bacterium]|jgi:mono/diheme cytochrome c family protein
MIRHFKIWVTVLGLVLAGVTLYFAGTLYVGGCSYRNNCADGGRAQFTHTPIFTLIPATLPANLAVFLASSNSENCTVTAEILLSSWISAGFPATQPFNFTDLNNVACQASYADLQPLFSQSNLWYPGALACTDCHNSSLSSAASAQLDLNSYVGILAGSHRSPGSATGVDILGAGNWQASTLNRVLFVNRQMPYGLPPNIEPASGPTILAGLPLSVVNATPAPTPSGVEIARPNTPGGTGPALDLTGDSTVGMQIYLDHCQMCHGSQGIGGILNPGSDDGTVPELNPIDPTLANPDYQTFAYNVDLFIQNGSRPAGVNPARSMPPWGSQNGLTQQQIADVIAYIISLNK